MILYRILSVLLLPLLIPYIFLRVLKGKEDFSRISERFGFINLPHGDKKILWLHAVSVGETNSAMIFLDELLKLSPNIFVVFTTTTLTSARILQDKINSSKNYQGRVMHHFLPLDSYFIVRKFINKINPEAIFFIESEIWPNFISYGCEQFIPTFLINARISQKSFLRWSLAKNLGFNVFKYFSLIFVQSKNDQQRFSYLSGKQSLFYGNLKSQAINLKFDENELQNLKNQIGARKFWLASSTHKGEEEIILATHKKLKENFSDLLTIIVPRHPNRADEISNLLKDFNFAQRSKNQTIKSSDEIYLADSLGELGLFYKLADFALIGGSLKDNIGGHNPFEAIKLNCAVLSGKYFFNFKDIYDELEKNKGCVIVHGVDEIAHDVAKFLKDKSALEPINKNALKIVEKEGDVVSKIIAEVKEIILVKL